MNNSTKTGAGGAASGFRHHFRAADAALSEIEAAADVAAMPLAVTL
jgi:hypothetical protein